VAHFKGASVPDEMDFETVAGIIDALRVWAEGHPARNDPFMAMMGEGARVLTPLEFLREVENPNSNFGGSFLYFVASQSRRYGIPPSEFVYRAVEANRMGSSEREIP
jgi:hypothetical protein